MKLSSNLKLILQLQLVVIMLAGLDLHATCEDCDEGTWNFATIKMKLMPDADFPIAEFETMILDSVSPWNNTGIGPFLEVEVGDENIQAPAFDGVNAIFVHPNWEWDPGLLALTFTHVDKASRTILEADIALNPGHNWVYALPESDPTAFDLQSTFTHEFGHVLGIPDLNDFPEATMFGEIQSFEDKKRDLDSPDTDCVVILYDGKELTEPFDPNAPSNNKGGCQSTQAFGPFSLLLLTGLFFRRRR